MGNGLTVGHVEKADIELQPIEHLVHAAGIRIGDEDLTEPATA
jgi:hypothetical protein